jgi:mannose/fructose/N-acetylgalactosamine-specific phosphotransferase system component IIC
MSRWARGLLRAIFAFVIPFLAVGFALSVRLIFHSQSDRLFGVGFLVALFCLVPLFQRLFPTVYSYGRSWWSKPGRGPEVIFVVVLAVIISILSSRVATLWFGLLIVSGVLVAWLLRVTRRDGEL